MSSISLYHPTLRAALRERLLTCVDINAHAPGVSVTLANGVFTRVSGSWLDAGFAASQEVTVTGFTGTLVGVVQRVAALALTTDLTGATNKTVAGGGAFSVKLPGANEPRTAIAWEGVSFTPVSGRPYLMESLRPNYSRKRGLGAGGTIEHQSTANFTLHYPAERGTLAIERMAGALMKHFEPGAVSLSRDGMRASIQNVGRSALQFDGAWVSCPIAVDLLSWTQS